MIVGPGWAFVALVAAGIAAFVLLPGIGLLVVDEAPSGHVRLTAPPLVQPDPAVEARSVASATLSPKRAKRQAQRRMLRIRTTGCDGIPTGAGFALDPRILIAQREVLPGAGALRVAPRGGRARKLRAPHVYRLGEFGVAQVDGRLPRKGAFGRDPALGASIAVVGYPLSAKPRLIPGVVVDRIAGARFGIPGRVIRLTSVLGRKEPGGPVIGASGRIVALAFATDPNTGLAVAVPVSTLEKLIKKRALESLPPCERT